MCPLTLQTTIARVSGGILVALMVLAQPAGAQPSRPPSTLSPAAQTVIPAVITVTIPNDQAATHSEFRPERPLGDSALEDLFRNLFGELLVDLPRQTIATGVILDPTGLALTSAHGLRRLSDIEAVTADGVAHKATVVGVDEKTDLAVLRLSGAGSFPFVPFGNSDEVRVGDWVIAIGSPFGLGLTVTAGIISATPRSRGQAAIEELFRTDAATYPDSAGGPLVTTTGEVVGFSTVMTGADFGIGFAIPSNMAKTIYAQLVRSGKVTRASLGIQVQRLTPGLAAAFGLRRERGLLITEVSANANGVTTPLRPGDVVLEINGQELSRPYDLDRALRGVNPGQTAALAVWRSRRERAMRVAVGVEGKEPAWTRTIPMLPFAVRPITPELGVAIARVDPGSPTADGGLRVGDVLREINQHRIRTITDVAQVANTVRPGEWVAVLVQRGRTAVYVAVTATSDRKR